MSLRTTDELLSETKPWVYVIDFKQNLLVWINATSLFFVFPNLQLIDLRQNPNVDCWRILELKISVRSDCNTKTETRQPLLQTTSSPVPSISLTTHRPLPQTTSSPVPSTSLTTHRPLPQTTSSPLVSSTLEQNHTLHSPHTAKDSELILIISLSVASAIGFLILLLCFYGCHRSHPRWGVWPRHRRASLHVQPPSQIEFLPVSPAENNEDLRTRTVTAL